LCQKATIPDYLFSELNEFPFSDERFDDVSYLRRDLGSLTKSLTKSCGATPVIQFTAQRIAQSKAKVSGASGDQYI
jgi:hypothetical protein